MKSSQLVSASIALVAGLSALCFESATALASPPTPSIPFAWSMDLRAGMSLERAKGWDFRLPQTPLAGMDALRFLGPAGPRVSTSSAPLWTAGKGVVSKRPTSGRSRWASAPAPSSSYASRMQPGTAALAVTALNGNPFDPTWPLYTMDPEAFAIAAPLMWATQQLNQREARSPYAKYACDPGSSGDGTCSGRPGAQRVSQSYMADVTTGVGLGMIAGWVVPKAIKETFGSRQRADLKSDVKAERDASRYSAFKLTIPDFIVYPSVTFGGDGALDGFGCSARGVFDL